MSLTFSDICNGIILIGAVCVAVKNIYNFVKKPKDKLKQKHDEDTKEQIKEVLTQELPPLLDQRDKALRERYLADDKRRTEEMQEHILDEIKDTLDGILEINLEQNKLIEILTQGSKDMMRQRIMDIYHKYKVTKSFPVHVKEALDELYKDYKAEGGNSYIDKYYARMMPWETYFENEDPGD